jgi:hypothetical protein
MKLGRKQIYGNSISGNRLAVSPIGCGLARRADQVPT